jgi:hypothetical protein
MSIAHELLALLTSKTGKSAMLSAISIALGWFGSSLAGWWKGRDRYRAHVTWQTTETMYGPREEPVIVIQSIHTLPINVTRLRVRNGFRRKTGAWPFDSEDPDYPELPRAIEPMKATKFWLNSSALQEAAEQSRLLDPLWVPRVYIGVETMGRGERLFPAEGGLDWNTRRKRYRR